MADVIIEKYCWACKSPKPTSLFPLNRSKPDGLGTECKPCRKLRDAAYHAEHREKNLARFKEYKRANPEYFREYGKHYYKAHKDKWRARGAEKYRANKETILAEQKAKRDANLEEAHRKEHEWYWRDPERKRDIRRRYYQRNAEEHNRKVKAYQAKHPDAVKRWKQKWLKSHPEKRRVAVQNNRAIRRRKGNGRYTFKQLCDKYAYHGWRCYLCQTPITLKSSHPDHRKPLGRGGSNWIANIAPACIKCNLRKNRRTEAEFRALFSLKTNRPDS